MKGIERPVTKGADRIYLSSDEFRVALDNLSQVDLLRLYKIGGIRALGTGMSGQDLLNEAIVRTLEGQRNCPADVTTSVFLANAMRSIASAERVKFDREVASDDGGDEDGLFSEKASESPNPEERAISSNNLEVVWEKLQKLFDGDPQAEAVIIGDMEGWGPDEIKELVPMNNNEYAAARKRVRRWLAQEFPKEERQ